MKKTERVMALKQWGHALAALLDEMESGDSETGNPLRNIVQQAYRNNPWFLPEHSLAALRHWVKLLEGRSLDAWISAYQLPDPEIDEKKKIGIIMAGNIPMVGFHDLLCVLVSGHQAVIKFSSDDNVIIPFLLEVLVKVAPLMSAHFKLEERFTDIDAVIATGSNNSARYFEFYFGKYPHIIRKNRNSAAVLLGNETEEELIKLGEDIFSYFGLGCRNVSKLYVPAGYKFDSFFRVMERFGNLMQHNKYMNNFDYHNALFMLNNEVFLTNNFLLLREHPSLSTPVSVVHYEIYNSFEGLLMRIEEEKDVMQCVVGKDFLPFGTSQQPGLADYADGVDTMAFLMRI